MMKSGLAALLAGAAAVLCGVVFFRREAASVAIIGGADGPTAIFIAGPALRPAAMAGIAAGVLVLAAGVWLLLKKRK